MVRRIDRSKWRAAKKGEPGYDQRWMYPSGVKHATEKTKHLSRRQYLQKTQGKRLEQLAALRQPVRRLQEGNQKFLDYLFKRRETAEKKKKYGGEKIKVIREYEKAKRKIEEKRPGEKPLSEKQYWTMRNFAEKHQDTEADFWKMLKDISPKKKRRRGYDRDRARRQAEREARRRGFRIIRRKAA
jgi:hypothetical protein